MLLVKSISLERLNKIVFEDISLSLTAGKILLLSGKNGSGKTSLLKIILKILEPTNGSIYWKGKSIEKVLNDYYYNITYIADKTSTIRQLTVNQNINIWKKIFLSNVTQEQIEDVLEILNLKNYLQTKVSNLSLGEIKKLELMRLIIENRKVWILDEPLSNLDADSIKIIGQTFEDHCKNNGSVIFSSHQNLNINISEEITLNR